MDNHKIEKSTIEYVEKREDLLEKLGEINAVANTEGKGRSDFALKVLAFVEDLCSRKDLPKSVYNICQKLKTSVNAFRVLLRKYSANIESVDPQLKNNNELVEVLCLIEEAWHIALNQVADDDKLQ